MPSHESDLELLQIVLDNTFGGNEEAFTASLDTLDRACQARSKESFPLFREVGNRCLVFFSNEGAAQACEARPEAIRGVIVDDFDVYFDPHSNFTVVGSLLRGCVGSPTVIRGGSEIVSSQLVHSEAIGSQVVSSYILNLTVVGSRIERSYLYGTGQVYRANLTACYSDSSTAIRGASATEQRFSFLGPAEGQGDEGFTKRMLEDKGISIPET